MSTLDQDNRSLDQISFQPWTTDSSLETRLWQELNRAKFPELDFNNPALLDQMKEKANKLTRLNWNQINIQAKSLLTESAKNIPSIAWGILAARWISSAWDNKNEIMGTWNTACSDLKLPEIPELSSQFPDIGSWVSEAFTNTSWAMTLDTDKLSTIYQSTVDKITENSSEILTAITPFASNIGVVAAPVIAWWLLIYWLHKWYKNRKWSWDQVPAYA